MRAVHLVATSSSSTAVGVVVGVVVLALAIAEVAGIWMVFRKGGKPGWAAIIPFFNLYTLLKLVGRPGWWLIGFFVPLVNIVVLLVVLWDVCRSFSKGWGWFFGLWLLPFIFWPMLGFGSSQYRGPAGDPDARDASGRLLRDTP